MKPIVTIISLMLLVAFATPAYACPTCKDALHDGLLVGYAISILFMMAMPFAIFAFWIVIIWRLRTQALSAANESLIKELASAEKLAFETPAR